MLLEAWAFRVGDGGLAGRFSNIFILEPVSQNKNVSISDSEHFVHIDERNMLKFLMKNYFINWHTYNNNLNLMRKARGIPLNPNLFLSSSVNSS